MSGHVHFAPVEKRLLSPGVMVLLGVMAVAGAAAVWRFVYGLEAVTNLDDAFPWGIWKALNVAAGMALATGGFTMAALVHIFHRERYEPILRAALFTGLLGYSFGGATLMIDLGRYYNFWHPAWPTMWQGNSVLFEVCMCVMAYLTVLHLELTPVVCERFCGRVALPGPLGRLDSAVEALLRLANRTLGKVMGVFILAGVVLSCMHHSSLGALMLVAPYKIHPLWYTPILPLLFLLSAIAVGFPVVVVEQMWSAKSFGRRPNMNVLGPLSRITLVLLGIYMIAKFSDLVIREAHVYLLEGSTQSWMFLVEVLFGVVAPWVMLLSPRVRRTPGLLLTAAALVVGGVVVNRLNVFLVAYNPPFTDATYFPSVAETLITVGVIAALAFAYRLVVTILPVLPAQGAEAHGSGR